MRGEDDERSQVDGWNLVWRVYSVVGVGTEFSTSIEVDGQSLRMMIRIS